MSHLASRSVFDSYQRITLPPIKLRDEPQAGQRQVEWHEPESEAQGPPQQLQSSPLSAPPSQSMRTEEDWRTSAPTRKSGVYSILNPTKLDGSAVLCCHNGPDLTPPSISAIHTFPGQQLPPDTSPTAKGYAGISPQGLRRILTPRSPSRAINAQRAAGHGNTYIRRLPSASSEVPPMPTPPTQSHEQQYGFPPSSGAPTDARHFSEDTLKDPMRTPLSQSASPSVPASSHNQTSSQTSPVSILCGEVGQPPQTSTSYLPGSLFGTTMQQGGVMQFQGQLGVLEGPYSAPPTQPHRDATHSSITDSSRQMSASDPAHVLTFSTLGGTYHVPVDVHQAPKSGLGMLERRPDSVNEERRRKEREASSNIERLHQQIKDIGQERDRYWYEREWYRHERDRLRDLLSGNPATRHLATSGPPSPRR